MKFGIITNVGGARTSRPKPKITPPPSEVQALRQRVIELEKIVIDSEEKIGELHEQREGDSIIIEELMTTNQRIEKRLEEMAEMHNMMANKVNSMDLPSAKKQSLPTVAVTTSNKHADNILDMIRKRKASTN